MTGKTVFPTVISVNTNTNMFFMAFPPKLLLDNKTNWEMNGINLTWRGGCPP